MSNLEKKNEDEKSRNSESSTDSIFSLIIRVVIGVVITGVIFYLVYRWYKSRTQHNTSNASNSASLASISVLSNNESDKTITNTGEGQSRTQHNTSNARNSASSISALSNNELNKPITNTGEGQSRTQHGTSNAINSASSASSISALSNNKSDKPITNSNQNLPLNSVKYSDEFKKTYKITDITEDQLKQYRTHGHTIITRFVEFSEKVNIYQYKQNIEEEGFIDKYKQFIEQNKDEFNYIFNLIQVHTTNCKLDNVLESSELAKFCVNETKSIMDGGYPSLDKIMMYILPLEMAFRNHCLDNKIKQDFPIMSDLPLIFLLEQKTYLEEQSRKFKYENKDYPIAILKENIDLTKSKDPYESSPESAISRITNSLILTNEYRIKDMPIQKKPEYNQNTTMQLESVKDAFGSLSANPGK